MFFVWPATLMHPTILCATADGAITSAQLKHFILNFTTTSIISASLIVGRPPQALVLYHPHRLVVAVVLVHAHKKAFGRQLHESTAERKCQFQFRHSLLATKGAETAAQIFARRCNDFNALTARQQRALTCARLHR